MILFELCGNTEQNPVYRELEVSNGNRQYDFLRSIVGAALAVDRAFLSNHIIKALNFQAITCLHTNAGEYRPCQVVVGNHRPPEHYRVEALMDDFVNMVNRDWEQSDPVALAALVLWRLNHIHPFINGNGRTARAACYFVLCVKAGGWLPGATILPELIRRDRAEYVDALRLVDESVTQGARDLSPLHELLSKLIREQLATQPAPADDQPD
ncbi:cell filamentation protein Fic [Pseudomonas chlororaphis]|uniref:Fic family protein n=1 Tax=Pseudomonas chlororaphis TaxID=587753 RepID=A0AAP9VTA0_9PSED|nr:Fic family protein [Pseudomonas chlororaphis]AUG43097.1 cell filamentation protein Fic [Pseudomonas chlororaphis]QNR46941.1 Fic family protein [Pseudomonas chlororaphis]